jgi:anti-sigma regulatory factor (Ser/Thr protein kinase)
VVNSGWGHSDLGYGESGQGKPPEATQTFEPNPGQVALARRFASASLAEWGIEARDIPRLVSELATNAVLHARSDFRIRLIAYAERIRVEVTDQNTRLPSFSVVPEDAHSGRGLMLVQAAAAAWGVEAHSDEGKTIWFEVACTIKR